MSARQDSDDLAWDRYDEIFEEALKYISLSSTRCKIESFAEKLFDAPTKIISQVMAGGFNVLYPVQLEFRPDHLLIRLPLPDQAIFPEEKTLAEAATARCIRQRTRLPVPEVSQYGVDPELGPFIVLEHLKSNRNMSRALEKPRDDPNDTPVLHPEIPEEKLQDLYGKMARCMLQLSELTFPRIGALVETSPSESYRVQGRPITMNMNNMVHLSNVPASIFPVEKTTYGTADEWYNALAEMHMATLVFQHNDMVSSEDDARTKYVARQLFRRLAKEGKLSKFGFLEDDWSAASKSQDSPATLPMPSGSGSFRLWCDDFRPVNVIVDEDDEVLGVTDWEFAYAAPTQFTLDPPWWLLLELPELWDDGIEDWAETYDGRLKTWLSAMEAAEQDAPDGVLRLSGYMRESWATDRFWLTYAARKSWAFDTIYWKYLDEKFFGKRGGDTEKLWEIRVNLLTDEEQAMMEPLVQLKMDEAKDRVLVEWDAEEARRRLSSFLPG